MKHIKTFESFLNEGNIAIGKEVARNKNLFKEVVDAILPKIQEKGDDVKRSDVEEWLEQDAKDNPTFDYLDDTSFTADSFFDWFDN